MQVLVIGGVAAGMSAAAKLKRNLRDGVDITVYEKGGAVSYGACGIPFFVSDRIKSEGELVARRPEEFKKSGVDVLVYHEVTAVDTQSKSVTVRDLREGRTFTRGYDKLIIGSGARVKKFPPFDKAVPGLCQIRDVEDGKQVKALLQGGGVHAIVIAGAGFIGLEMADACRQYGKEVTVVEAAPRMLTAMDGDITAPLAAELERNGVALKTGTKVTALCLQDGAVCGAKLQTPEGEEEIPCQLVLNCAGIEPATDFIDGVEKAPNGAIIVDEAMRTRMEDVYAAGDCTVMRSAITGELMYAPLGTNANKQGRIIADVIAGNTPKPFKLLGSTAIKLFSLDAAKVGLSEEDAKKAGIPCLVSKITGNSYASYYGTEKLDIKVVYHQQTRKILGAQVVGQGVVVPRANYYAIAIYAGLTVDQFGFMDLCYSPPFSGVWDAALIASNAAK